MARATTATCAAGSSDVMVAGTGPAPNASGETSRPVEPSGRYSMVALASGNLGGEVPVSIDPWRGRLARVFLFQKKTRARRPRHDATSVHFRFDLAQAVPVVVEVHVGMIRQQRHWHRGGS